MPHASSYRRIQQLDWVELTDYGPIKNPKQPRKASVKRGLAYEKKVGRSIKRRNGELGGDLYIGQWLLFKDKNGHGKAQPDIYIVYPELIVIIECKLTQTDSVVPQLLQLYLPLIKKLYDRPAVCLQVCKNLRYKPRKLIGDVTELINNPGPGIWTWHFIG